MKMFDLENEGQGVGVQHPQWRRSTENIKIFTRHYTFLFLCASFAISEIYYYLC